MADDDNNQAPLADASQHYTKAEGKAWVGDGEVPFSVECWARCERLAHGDYTDEQVELLINGEPNNVWLGIGVNSNGLWLSGCDIDSNRGPRTVGGKRAKRARYKVRLNLITPRMHVTPCDRTPILYQYHREICSVVRKSCGNAYQAMAKSTLPELARRPPPRRPVEDDIFDFAFRFGIVGDDLDQMFEMIFERHKEEVECDPVDTANKLIAELSDPDRAKPYVQALQDALVVLERDVEERMRRGRERDAAHRVAHLAGLSADRRKEVISRKRGRQRAEWEAAAQDAGRGRA